MLEELVLTIKCQVASNSIALNLYALLDSGAEGEAFINQQLYNIIRQWLQPKVLKLKNFIVISDHDNKKTDMLRKIFQTNLVINKWCISTWFFFCNISHHDILLDCKWFEKNEILIDYSNQKLIWSDNTVYSTQKDITISQKKLVTSQSIISSHQKNVNHQEKNMIKQVKKKQKKFKIRIL